ncbi:MAG: hypothetical protein F6K19_08455 [Cyanothece sp. SIO1E1]|nr:hypothetical protein [Cyanothece sp. SIO1E1]
MDDLLQVAVEESLHLPGTFTLVLRNDYQPMDPNEEVWKHQDLLKMGEKVKIGLLSSLESDDENQSNGQGDSKSDDKTYLIEGEITAIETHFSDRTQAPIIIRGYDLSHRLHRGRHNRSFQNMIL